MELVLHYVLPILTVAWCSIVFDVDNQAPEISKYCKAVGKCMPGEHVMCMYGEDLTVMGPRCGGGQSITMTEDEEKLTVDTINRSELALSRGTGKDGEHLPRAYTMMRLLWDKELAAFARVWANQCDLRKDFCRSTAYYPTAGQSVACVRFQYPNWDLAKVTFKDTTPEFTSEKRQYVIETYLGLLHDLRSTVTDSMIRKHGNNSNAYLLMVHGPSTHVGCAMSTYIDYYDTSKETPVIYYTAEMVCNFSDQPHVGRKVYETSSAQGIGWTSCGCSLDYTQDKACLCVLKKDVDNKPKPKGDKGNKPTEKPPINKGDNSKEKGDKGQKGDLEKGDKGQKGQKGDLEKGDKGQKGQKGDLEKGDKGQKGDLEKGDKSKEKGDNSKETKGDSKEKGDNSQENSNKGIRPVPSCGAGNPSCKSPVVVMPIIKVEDANSETLKQVEELETPSMTTLEQRKEQIRERIKDRVQNVRDRYFNKNMFIEPGTRFSNGGEVGESDFALSTFETGPYANPDLIHRETTRYNVPTKSRSNINIKPRKDFSNLEELVSEYLSYKHGEAAKSPPKAVYRRFNYIRQIGSKPYDKLRGDDRSVNYKYPNNINNHQSPSIRKLRYGVQGFNYNKSPYIRNPNDEHDQLSTDLYNLEEKSEDFAIRDNVNENMRTHNWDVPTKPTRNGNPMIYSKAIEYATNEDIPPNMAYYARTKVQRPFTRPVARIQNPLHSHSYTTNHYDYSKEYRSNQQVRSRSMLMKLADDENEDTDTQVYGYSRRQNRPNDGKNDVRNYYLDRLKNIRPYRRPNNGYGDSNEFNPRYQRGSGEQRADKQHFYIPDRMNRDQDFY